MLNSMGAEAFMTPKKRGFAANITEGGSIKNMSWPCIR